MFINNFREKFTRIKLKYNTKNEYNKMKSEIKKIKNEINKMRNNYNKFLKKIYLFK